jgi:FkbM family methyltransferase
MRSLQAVPIEFADRPPIYVDLRGNGWNWLKGTPWVTAPDELDEQELIKRILRSSDVVYDIGANIGLYTTLFAGLGCKVVAFEPNIQLLRTLRITVAHLRNVMISPVALSDTKGRAMLYVPNDHTMGSLADYTSAEELGQWKAEIGLTRSETVECETETLDNFVDSGAPSPDFIKCDVEGAELKVFLGGRNTLQGPDAPLILFEVLEMCSDGFGVEKLAAANFLKDLGYELFDLGPNGTLHPMIAAPKKLNVLAVPVNRKSRVLTCLRQDA